MTIELFAAKWFTSYYFVLGLLFFCGGIVLTLKTDACKTYLLNQAKTDKPPSFLRSVLKYFFIFTIPGLILSFFPFLWFELLFALWSLLIVFAGGLQLVRWPQTRLLIKSQSVKIKSFTQWSGVLLLAIGLAVIWMGYQELQRLFQM